MKRTIILLLFIAALFVFEPVYRDKLTFALTYFGDPTFSYENVFSRINQDTGVDIQEPVRERARAPEPNTFILMLSGIAGMIMRFARRSFERFKRLMDVGLSVIGLTLTMPVLLYAALVIKLTSRGPVIYRQKRVGRNGSVFSIYKLRTMNQDAEKATGAVWATKNDPRITRVGKVLRKTRIDEIPQFFNVLRGEMSIVGPRPERPEMVRDLRN
ncbi:MAG: sugar transferase, partial [Candidatus Omnitrophica bacterium]|nr:sugar transferase [Candidatus Omnitrophota bacterium]